MNKNERLLYAIGSVNEKYIKEAESDMKRISPIGIAVSFALIIALSLYLFIPFAPVTSNLTAYEGSSYFPLIEGIEDYRLSFMQPKYKNNFEAILSSLLSFKSIMAPGDMNGGAAAPEYDSALGKGEYVEVTDNQVQGVIESDLFKMTENYIFRLGYSTEYSYPNGDRMPVLRVYSVDKENSALISEFNINPFDDEGKYSAKAPAEMFLSADGNTVTILRNYTDNNGQGKVGLISIDVTDVSRVKEKSRISIDGSLNTSRMVDGKLLIVTEFYFNRNTVDYNNPASFVPSISRDGEKSAIEFENIIFPDSVSNTRYSVVALMDSENLALLGANALLNFTSDVYISENNLFITREYNTKIEEENQEVTKTQTDIAVLNYAGESLENKGVITIDGQPKDQYSFDEKDGYLRVVSSTFKRTVGTKDDMSFSRSDRNVSLYVFDLETKELAYSVLDFAIPGEEASAVRFEGDMLYVCTAVIVNFTDPVYFFDLSDYENITFSDTGVIEGYSDHLIDLGEGFLLGIGRENWQYNKVEIYEEGQDGVVSVDKILFEGNISTDYKAFYVNRQQNIFALGVKYYAEQNGQNRYDYDCYVVFQFDGYKLNVTVYELTLMEVDSVRAVYLDGCFYITTDFTLTVKEY